MIHICIYSFHKDPFLMDCIKSISNSLEKNYFVDLYVFSKGSDKNKDIWPIKNIEVTSLNKIESFSYIANISLKKALECKHSYFLLLNSDTILHNKCLTLLSEFLQKRPEVGVVGGYQTKYQGDWDTANDWTLATINSDPQTLLTNTGSLTFHTTNYVQGACMMFKTDIVDRIGFFEGRFVFFYEETEFCRRVIREGLFVGILKEAKVKHYGGGTWRKNIFLSYKRDLFYLSNQIIFESTEFKVSLGVFIAKIFSIVKKQVKQVYKKEDQITISLFLYPLVLFLVFTRSGLLIDLYKAQQTIRYTFL